MSKPLLDIYRIVPGEETSVTSLRPKPKVKPKTLPKPSRISRPINRQTSATIPEPARSPRF